MAAPTDTRFFDVWIIERNTVYQKVPFTVVADWTQEGRLLETDKVRPAGTTVWQKLGDHPLLTAYLPQSQPTHAEDTAEALKEIELDFPGKKPEAEDNDPDMIPLIDVSLVLLVFFMMTAQNLLTQSPVNNPEAKSARMVKIQGLITVTLKSPGGGKIEYFVGDDYSKPLTEDQCVKEVETQQKASKHSKVIVQADKTLPYDKVQELTIKLERTGTVKFIQARVKHVGGGSEPGTGSGGEGNP
jgi:biopolymer transport protein ExbD